MKRWRLSKSGFFLLGLLLLSWSSERICSAQPIVSRPETLPQNKLGHSNASWLRADFDGDSRADLAQGRLEARAYQVEIQLQTRQEKIAIPIAGSEVGIWFFADDVDQDSDQDLIITNGTSLYPLAIWINDGTGHFEEGNRWSYINLLLSIHPSGFDDNSSGTDQVAISNNERLRVDRSIGSFVAAKLEVQDSIASESENPSLPIFLNHLTTRSPPLNQILQS